MLFYQVRYSFMLFDVMLSLNIDLKSISITGYVILSDAEISHTVRIKGFISQLQVTNKGLYHVAPVTKFDNTLLYIFLLCCVYISFFSFCCMYVFFTLLYFLLLPRQCNEDLAQ
ncbi:hypothetical protein QE152_g6449 [Popillia japonica]|uniref:Uncharacterized protein n=1 Tax=Popillia japonica TaxID=7064 RepID=A0AAW1MJ57_POPJA